MQQLHFNIFVLLLLWKKWAESGSGTCLLQGVSSGTTEPKITFACFKQIKFNYYLWAGWTRRTQWEEGRNKTIAKPPIETHQKAEALQFCIRMGPRSAYSSAKEEWEDRSRLSLSVRSCVSIIYIHYFYCYSRCPMGAQQYRWNMLTKITKPI